MKKNYPWYFPLSEVEIDEIWKNGILTVDTNVLLDLYRYHESTRSSLINSLKSFGGRKWLSNQASAEFIRNRKKVIISAEKTFKQASDEADKLNTNLQGSIAQLKGNRIIPADTTAQLMASVEQAIKVLREQISSAKDGYPRFLELDPVLTELTELFADAVGEPFDAANIDAINAIAEERKIKKIPPGYLDADKNDDRPYGDYFLWRQILEKAKSENSPVLLVTSERSEDWWEVISGKTTGPRPEMLREAYEYVGKPILIYRTERFLEIALKRQQLDVSDEALEEIRAVSTSRTSPQSIASSVQLIEQTTISASPQESKGFIKAQLNRPLRSFTVSGHFDPILDSSPVIHVHSSGVPGDAPSIKIKAATGTTYDFNVHFKAEETGMLLPPGVYEIYYEATCNNSENSENPPAQSSADALQDEPAQ